MITVPLPRYHSGEVPPTATVALSILRHDQFDDWLPDPVYFEDARCRVDAWARAIDASREQGRREFEAPEPIAVPRGEGRSIPAAALPLDLRVCCQLTAAAFARRDAAEPALLRDKVFGFACLAPDPGGRLFQPPGAELDEAIGQAVEAAGHQRLTVLDVREFAANSSIVDLRDRLLEAGLRERDEWPLLAAALGSAERGVPSLDDGMAYLGNHYLAPADRALADGRHNFVRYRDEFFLFTPDAVRCAREALSRLGLEARAIEFNLARIESTLEDEAEERAGRTRGEETDASTEVAVLQGGTLALRLVGQGWTGSDFTDGAEVTYDLRVGEEGPEPALAEDLARVFGAAYAPVDAVALLPAVRATHRLRADQALSFAGNAATPEFSAYRRQLASMRGRLLDWLEAVCAAGDLWTVVWVSRLAADSGRLNDREAARVAACLTRDLPAAARGELRLLLARASALPASAIWPDGTPALDGGRHARRCEAVAASFVRRRGQADTWAALARTLPAREPDLFALLDPLES